VLEGKTRYEEEKEFYWKLRRFGTVSGMTYEDHWIIRKDYEKRKNKKKTVRDNISKKSLDMFATVTLEDRDKALVDNLKRVQYSWKDACDKLGIDYCMLPELHEDNVSIHLHGFIRVDDKTTLERKYYPQDVIRNGRVVKKKGSPVMRRGKPVYTIPHLERYFGFVTLQYLPSDDVEMHKQVNYMLKYATKSRQEIEFKLMSSRPKKKNQKDCHKNEKMWYNRGA